MSAQKHRSLVKLILLAVGAFFIFVTQTQAETTETTAATTATISTAATPSAHPCKADVEKFCKDVKPGGGKLNACMKEHETEFSQACQDKRAEHKAKIAAAQKACEPDVTKFCKDIKTGNGAVKQCLQSHETELSQACRDTNLVKKKHAHGKPIATPTTTPATQ